jgi:hypothetical protein
MRETTATALSFAALGVIISLGLALLLIPHTIPNAGAVTPVGVDVFWDFDCTNAATSISWGTIEPGGTKSQTVYIKNNEPVAVTLSIDYDNWNPPSASSYITPSWNCTRYSLGSGSVVGAALTLTVSQDASEVTNFGFDITITGVETESAETTVNFTTSGLPNGVNVTFTVNGANHTGAVPYTYSEWFYYGDPVSFSAPPKILGASGVAYFFTGWKDENNNTITSPITMSAFHIYCAQYQMKYVGTLTATVRDTSYKTMPNALIYLDGTYAGFTDSNGRLAISAVPTGSHPISASKEEYNTASTTAYVYKGWSTNVYLTLRVKTYSLTVYVKDQNGNAVPYAYAYLNGTYKGATASSGKCVITGLARGNYTLRLTKYGYLDYTSPMAIQSDITINITQIKTCTVTIMVKDSATAKAVSYADVYLDGVKVGTTDYYYGRLIIRNVTPGTHTFTIKKIGYADNSTTTNIASDTTLTITITKG